MLEIIILAAGRGTRMRSPLPKVLHHLAGRPLLEHVVETAAALAPSKIHVVVGVGAGQVIAAFEGTELAGVDIVFHEQKEQLGTGHAVSQALPGCHPDSVALVLFGDVPLVSANTLSSMVGDAASSPVMLAAKLDDPSGYGRVIRDDKKKFVRVVEHRDAGVEELAVNEVNTGVLAASVKLLSALLERVENNNSQSEYYLPDVLGLAREDGIDVAVVLTGDPIEMAGVNDRLQLEELERTFQQRKAESLMQAGVAIADRRRLDIRGSLTCGEGVSIDVNVVFEGTVHLGSNVRIGPNCVISNAVIGDDAEVLAFTHIEDVTVGAQCRVGPYARLRPGTVLGERARVGNFVETKKAIFGAGSKANHLAYIGDATLGENCNVGAGTITCNYDGVNKHPTLLGDDVFVGSNSTLVAPVELKSDSFVAAGSVLTKTVESGDLAVGRARQRNISGWQRPAKEEDH